MVIQKLLLTGLVVVVSADMLSQSAQADTQEEIEARIRALNTELYQLRQQLQQIDSPEEAAQGVPPKQLPEEVALEDLSDRRQWEQESSRNPFSITTHRTNYLFPVSYNTNQDANNFREVTDASGPNNNEVKFQFSAKFNLAEDIFGNVGDVYFAYTQRSWWQAYNTDASSPFRKPTTSPRCSSTSTAPGALWAG